VRRNDDRPKSSAGSGESRIRSCRECAERCAGSRISIGGVADAAPPDAGFGAPPAFTQGCAALFRPHCLCRPRVWLWPDGACATRPGHRPTTPAQRIFRRKTGHVQRYSLQAQAPTRFMRASCTRSELGGWRKARAYDVALAGADVDQAVLDRLEIPDPIASFSIMAGRTAPCAKRDRCERGQCARHFRESNHRQRVSKLARGNSSPCAVISSMSPTGTLSLEHLADARRTRATARAKSSRAGVDRLERTAPADYAKLAATTPRGSSAGDPPLVSNGGQRLVKEAA